MTPKVINRCFSSGGSPRTPILFNARWQSIALPGFPIRKFRDQCLCAAPPDLSQLVTSFFGSRCQGIPLALLSAWPRRSKVHSVRNTLPGIPHSIPLLLLFLANPLALGFARIDSGSHQELCRLQIRFIVVLCYPFKKSTKVYFVTSLLLARNFLLAFTVQFSRCKPLILFQDQIEMLGRLPKHFNPF